MGSGPLEILEYGDFECPDCGEAFPLIRSWQKELSGKLTFVFRNMPLDQLYPIHPNATMAAQAAEAAAKQGRFWEMHDLLFENQSDLSEDALIALAGRIGLDEEQFVEDLDSAAMAEKVRLSVNDGQEKGITATPTFFINGEKVEDSRNYAQVLELLKSKLAA
jgi:protein-disulfide isomerase